MAFPDNPVAQLLGSNGEFVVLDLSFSCPSHPSGIFVLWLWCLCSSLVEPQYMSCHLLLMHRSHESYHSLNALHLTICLPLTNHSSQAPSTQSHTPHLQEPTS